MEIVISTQAILLTMFYVFLSVVGYGNHFFFLNLNKKLENLPESVV